jgi:2-oxoisovalerate dehydrogenase E1 component alpha subunit
MFESQIAVDFASILATHGRYPERAATVRIGQSSRSALHAAPVVRWHSRSNRGVQRNQTQRGSSRKRLQQALVGTFRSRGRLYAIEDEAQWRIGARASENGDMSRNVADQAQFTSDAEAAMSNRPALRLHIPRPHSLPGQPASFDHLQIPAAGIVPRPPVDAPAAQLADLPLQLVRVLNDAGHAVGPWDPHLSPEHLKRGLRAMLLTRIFDDRMFRAHRQGKTSFFMKSTGEEAIGAAPSLALHPDDMSFPTYRVVSWLIARDYPIVNLMHQIFSNAKDPLGGRQLPVLYSARKYGFYSISGNVGSRIGHAVGWAMASAYKGDTKIALGYIGEGSTAEGAFHEALTFAAVYRAPVVLCVTNNQYAISSFSGIAGGELTTFAARALGYGIPGLRADGNDFLAVHAVTQWAAERARMNLGPSLIEFFTYRVEGHSTSDDPNKYRPADEPQKWPLGDPIERLKQHLIVLGEWSEEQHAQLVQECQETVRAAAKEAEAVGTLGQSKPPTREMFERVYKEMDWRHREQMRELGIE